MMERSIRPLLSDEEQLQRMTQEELNKELIHRAKQLHDIGVSWPIAELLPGVESIGPENEFVRNKFGKVQITGANLNAVIVALSGQFPNLDASSPHGLLVLNESTAKIALALEENRKRNEGADILPHELVKNPTQILKK
jgi:hypothetical protein